MIYLSIIVAVVLLGLGLGLYLSEKALRALILALRSLWLHKLRAFLSVLGIIIGTCSVITLMALGEGSMQDALEAIKRQGATNIIVRSVKPPDDGATQRRNFVAKYGLTYEDYARMLTIPTVVEHVPMRISFPQEVRRLERLHNCRLVATTPEYVEVNKLTPISGRFLLPEDGAGMLNVVVLGSKVADALFPFDDPLGKTVRLDKYFYEVIGVMGDRMPTGGGSQAAEHFNDDVYIPLETCRARFGERIFTRQSGARSGEEVQLHQVTLMVGETEQVRPAGDVVRNLLERHLKKDWVITIPLDRLEEAEQTKTRYNYMLAGIASISLVVGGIGIMNIMLATVTERTREIGIRRALGAKRRDITLQFLIEAMVQTSLGGMVGTLIGLGAVYATPPVCRMIASANVPTQLHVPSIFLSLGVSIGVGVAFGLYPARRAALLDPIEALRHE